MKTNLIILAAGNSTRFQGNKLLHIWQGKPLIEHVFMAVKPVAFAQVIVVTQYEEVMRLAQTYGFQVVENKQIEKGISHSIMLGLQASPVHEQTMFLVGDQPFIKASTLQKMLDESDGCHITCAVHQGIIKNPIIFPCVFDGELCALQGDQGGKQVVHRHNDQLFFMEVDECELQDIDRPIDLS